MAWWQFLQEAAHKCQTPFSVDHGVQGAKFAVLCLQSQPAPEERSFSSNGLLPFTNSSAICCHKKSICLLYQFI